MDVISSLPANWDSVLVVLLFAAVLIVLIAKKQYAILTRSFFHLSPEPRRNTAAARAQRNWRRSLSNCTRKSRR